MSKKLERQIFGMEVKTQVDEVITIDGKSINMHECIKISQGQGFVRLSALQLAGLYQLQKDEEFNTELLERLKVEKAKAAAV